MTTTLNPSRLPVSRRGLLAGSAAAFGGFSLGFHIPCGEALAQDAVPELNAWVVVRPDETVVIRIARSEMGQGVRSTLPALIADAFGGSRSEARRLLVQGGVKLDGAPLDGAQLDLDPARLDGAVLQAGKRKFVRLISKS